MKRQSKDCALQKAETETNTNKLYRRFQPSLKIAWIILIFMLPLVLLQPAAADSNYSDNTDGSTLNTNLWTFNNPSAQAVAMRTPPVIEQQPANITVSAPNPATFTVIASGKTPMNYHLR